MFKKLVTNLPFHPTLLGEAGFYIRRLRQEESLRRLGMVFVVLTLTVQIFAVLSPAKSSLATSTADIVYGATSKDDVLSAYKKNKDPQGRTDIQAIFNYYGIGKDQIESAEKTVISDKDNDKYINTSRSQVGAASTFVKIPSAIDGGIFEFPLKYWNKANFPQGYPAITGMSTNGFRFWILLKGCGNIVIEKGSKKPILEIDKSLTSNKTVRPGDTVSYKIDFRNSGMVASENTRIVDNFDPSYSYQGYTSTLDLNFTNNGQSLKWEVKSRDATLSPSERWHRITINFKVKDGLASATNICNKATIKAQGVEDKTSGGPGTCTVVKLLTCPGTNLPIPPEGVGHCTVTCPDGSVVKYTESCPVPQASCQDLIINSTPSWDTRKLETKFIGQKGATVSFVKYFVQDKLVATEKVSPGATSNFYTHTFATPGNYTVKSDIVTSSGQVVPSQSCLLEITIDQPTSPLVKIITDKEVSNITKGIADANNTLAAGGDTIRYNLIIENTGTAPAKALSLTGEYADDITDILEYADLIDKGDALFSENTHTLSWAPVNIEPGHRIVKTFVVKVKDPLPATPISVSNPLSFDFTMKNKYGREVLVNLPKPASKIVEQATTNLPNTGPGVGMIISVVAVTIVGYFFFRSRLLARELSVIRDEFITGGL